MTITQRLWESKKPEIMAGLEAGRTLDKIAADLEVCESTLRKQMSRWGIQARSFVRCSAIDAPQEAAIRVLREQRWTQERIAQHLGVAIGTVTRFCRLHGITGRLPRQVADVQEIVRLHRVERWSQKRIAAHYGFTQPYVSMLMSEAGYHCANREKHAAAAKYTEAFEIYDCQ